jgi:nitrogen regulatory protein P-II 1
LLRLLSAARARSPKLKVEFLMKKIEALIPPVKLDEVKAAVAKSGVRGMTLFEVVDSDRHKGRIGFYRGVEYLVDTLPKIKIEIIVEDDEVEKVVDTIIAVLRTGHLCDGQIAILPMEAVIRLRTGEYS